MRTPHARSARGFTMLELMMAMTIFSLLGMLVVMLMRQGMNIFTAGTRDSVLQDRMDTVLPEIQRRLEVIALPSSFDPPPPPPTEEERLAGADWKPPPPVDVRVRSTTVVLGDVPEGPLKGLPCFYAAWVTDISGERSSEILRRAGERPGPDMKEVDPSEEDEATEDTLFKPTGGLMEVCYVAVPEDEVFPALLTLYLGWRSPVGGEGSLLDEKNLDTLEEIHKSCRPVARGLLYFGITWRRVFATNWEPTPGKIGERDPYVGWIWDSTRALDKKFPLYEDDLSLGDPSDDVFPAWARLEVVLVAPTTLGLGRGETRLLQAVGHDARTIFVLNPPQLTGPGDDDRYLKVDGEWMEYRVSRIDPVTGEVPVTRGARNTLAAPHEADADVYVGLESRRDVRLLFRDRFAKDERGGVR